MWELSVGPKKNSADCERAEQPHAARHNQVVGARQAERCRAAHTARVRIEKAKLLAWSVEQGMNTLDGQVDGQHAAAPSSATSPAHEAEPAPAPLWLPQLRQRPASPQNDMALVTAKRAHSPICANSIVTPSSISPHRPAPASPPPSTPGRQSASPHSTRTSSARTGAPRTASPRPGSPRPGSRQRPGSPRPGSPPQARDRRPLRLRSLGRSRSNTFRVRAQLCAKPRARCIWMARGGTSVQEAATPRRGDAAARQRHGRRVPRCA